MLLQTLIYQFIIFKYITRMKKTFIFVVISIFYTCSVVGQAMNMYALNLRLVNDTHPFLPLGNSYQFDLFMSDGPETVPASWTALVFRFHFESIPNDGSVFAKIGVSLVAGQDFRIDFNPAALDYVNTISLANFQPGTPDPGGSSKGFSLNIVNNNPIILTPPSVPILLATISIKLVDTVTLDYLINKQMVTRRITTNDGTGAITSTNWAGNGGDFPGSRKTIGGGFNVLPITLNSFSAFTKSNCDNEISWETSSEVNIKSFELQHSLDGRNFLTITTIPARGVGQTKEYYKALHKPSIYSANHYYRLKIVNNQDLLDSYSKVIVTLGKCNTNGNNFDWRVYPNPTNGSTMSVEFTKGNTEMVRFAVLDATGKRIAFYETVNSGRFDLPIDQLAPGAYFLQYLSTDAIVTHTKKIIKY